MARTEQNDEAMRMAISVITEWLNSPDDFGPVQAVISSYAREDVNAVALILGGMIPIAGSLTQAVAELRESQPGEVLHAIAAYLARGDGK